MRIKQKVIVGFSVIAILVAVIGLWSTVNISWIIEKIYDTQTTNKEALIASDINASMSNILVNANKYINDRNDLYLESARKYIDNTRKDIQLAEENISKTDRIEILERIKSGLENYAIALERVAALYKERDLLVAETLDVIGPIARRNLSQINNGATLDQDYETANIAARSSQHFLLVRLYIHKFMATNRESDFSRAQSEMAYVANELNQLEISIENAVRKKLLSETIPLIAKYKDASQRLREIILERNNIQSSILTRIGVEVSGLTSNMKTSASNDNANVAEEAANQASLAEIQIISVAFVTLFLALLLALSISLGITRPLTRLVNNARKVADGDCSVSFMEAERNDEIGDIGRAFNDFTNKMLQLQKQEQEEVNRQNELNREIKLMSELNEWLQSSNSLDELFKMVSAFMEKLIPNCAGLVYIYSNSRDVLEGACAWNGARHDGPIKPDACWGLRRGRTYIHGEHEINFTCEHVKPQDGLEYVCVPILAHGETVGLMHLTPKEGTPKGVFLKERKLAQMAAEQISMAVANTRMRDELHHHSSRDPLTSLFNRRHFLENFRNEIETSRHTKKPISLISIDVDHFKTFNDNYGHDAGDMVLRAVGGTLEDACDGKQLPCRIGGEEFVILLPQTSIETASIFAEDLRAEIEAISVRYGEKNLPNVTVSAGVASHPNHGTMPINVMKSADDALYKAKARGRNRVVIAGTDTNLNEIVDEDLDRFDAVQRGYSPDSAALEEGLSSGRG